MYNYFKYIIYDAADAIPKRLNSLLGDMCHTADNEYISNVICALKINTV